MGKGDKRRPCLVPQWLEDLRWDLFFGRITMEKYEQILKEHKDK